MSTPSPLTPAQQLAVGLLAQGKSVTETAAAAGVSRSTLGRWRRLVEFAGAVQGRTEQVVRSAEAVVAEGREEILRLTKKTAHVIEEAMAAESYIVDGTGEVTTFVNHRVRLKAAELQLRVAALLVNKVEHTGELQFSRMTDEELADAISRLDAAIEG